MKSEILHLLRNADGYISGQQLCEAFGVSRTAVWKAINQLKEEGYVIDSVQNKGYRITEYPDIITDTEIRSLLIKDSAIKSRADKEQDREAGNKDRNVSTDKEAYNKLKDNSSDDNKLEGIFQHIRYFEKTDSTNNQAKLAAESNAPDGTLFVAECQTGGRGRRGRSWESPAGTGIWMSLLLRPDMSPESASMLTLVLAIAMVEAIREEVKDIDCYIKWPNDIVVNGKKITGILTEMSAEMDLIHYVVIGIGINVNTTEFDEAIRDMATSLYLETHRKIKRSNIIAAFSRSFDKYYHEFLKTNDLSLLVDKYNKLLINKDRTVRAIYEKEELIATAIGINKEGAACLSSQAVLKIGAGISTLISAESLYDIFPANFSATIPAIVPAKTSPLPAVAIPALPTVVTNIFPSG